MALKQHAHRSDDIAEIRDALVSHAGDLAQHLLGASNAKLSSKRELRWGNHGSFSVVLTGARAGVWRNHETNEAGDMLALIMCERHCDFAEALKFGREFIGGHFGGIDALTVLGETNDGGANARAVKEVAAKWHLAEREVFVMLTGDDLNDAWRKAAP